MKWISVKEQLPEVNELVFICGAMKYNNESEYEIFTDIGNLTYDGNWECDNDWDEGQPWAIVGWLTEPKLPSEEEIRKHNINWQNS